MARFSAFVGTGFLILGLAAAAQTTPATALRARDQGDVAALQAMAAKAQAQAASVKTAAAYLDAAQLESWLCEAALDRQQTAVVKQAAQAGADAAEKALVLAPKSSEANRLRGSLLGEVISTGGMMAGMRYGAASTQALDRAIQLDPENARAYIARGTGYLYTPDAFGGSKTKALAMFQKAAAIAPKLDSAHLWLAQAYLAMKQPATAAKEARAALQLNPNRLFTQYTLQQAEAAHGK